jgi:thiosulfate reductase cytochrome b subunit
MQKNQDTVLLHPLVVRLTHWAWALGVLVLIGSGLRIYESDPVFESVAFPVWITLGGSYEDTNKLHNDFGLAAALLWHFAAMWLLFASLPVFLLWAWLSGHFRRRYLPVTAREVVGNVTDFLRWRLPHDIGMRNAVQKLLYAFALADMVVMVLSGLVLWKPVQFQTLSLLMGQYEGARYVHFFGMAGIVGFVIVHVALTLLVPKVLPPMITGRAPRTAEPAASPGDAS